jgi:hypothetical protein
VALLRRDCEWHRLRWILFGSFLLNVAGIWWGVPDLWAGDELTPQGVFLGWMRRSERCPRRRFRAQTQSRPRAHAWFGRGILT